MPQSPDSEIPFYSSSSDKMRSRPFEGMDQESGVNDPLRAAHEFLFRGGTGGSGDAPAAPSEGESMRKARPWLIPLVLGCLAMGTFMGYMASSAGRGKAVPEETTAGKIITTTQASETYGTVIGTDVRIRKYPSLDAEIISKVNDGERLKVTGTATSGWYPVEFPPYGERGYVFGAYLATTDGSVAFITQSTMSMRSMSDFSSPEIELIPYGTRVIAIPHRDNWYKTYLPDGRSGYIYRRES